MSRLDTTLSEIFSLNSMKESILLNILEERKILKGYASNMTNEVRKNRFSRGECCLYCKSESVCKNGTYKNKQRYLCKGEYILACVHSCRSFVKFAKNTDIELQRIKSGKKKKVYTIFNMLTPFILG